MAAGFRYLTLAEGEEPGQRYGTSISKSTYPIRQVVLLGGHLRTHALSSFVLPLLLAAGALGQSLGNRTYVGQDIFVAAGQQVHNATCLFCSVQVEGDLTGHVFVLFGSLNVSC